MGFMEFPQWSRFERFLIVAFPVIGILATFAGIVLGVVWAFKHLAWVK